MWRYDTPCAILMRAIAVPVRKFASTFCRSFKTNTFNSPILTENRQRKYIQKTKH